MMCAGCSAQGHRQGGTAGHGTPGQGNRALLLFSLENALANANSDHAEGQHPSLRMGPSSSQHTGFLEQGLAAAPLARSQPQLLLGSAQARQGMISITGGTAAAPEDMDEANPFSKSYLN